MLNYAYIVLMVCVVGTAVVGGIVMVLSWLKVHQDLNWLAEEDDSWIHQITLDEVEANLEAAGLRGPVFQARRRAAVRRGHVFPKGRTWEESVAQGYLWYGTPKSGAWHMVAMS